MKRNLIFILFFILISIYSCKEEKFEKKIFESDIQRDTITKNGLVKNYYILSGKLAETGVLKNGVKDSLWKFYTHQYNNHLKRIVNYSNGEINGEWIEFNSDSVIIEKSNYINGKLDGNYFEYFDNGKIRLKTKYKGGEYHGAYKSLYGNGKIYSQGKYVYGLKEGKFKRLSIKGKLLEQATYKQNKLEGLHLKYYEQGLLEEKSYYKNGMKNGLSVLYEYVPALKRHYKSVVGYYRDDMKHGLFKYYDYYYDVRTDRLGSKLILTGATKFRNGLEHGEYKEYHPKYGFLLISSNYSNGVEDGIRKSYCPSGPDRGKLYIVQKVINGNVQPGDYYCGCP